MLREIQAVPFLGALQGLAMSTHFIQSIEFHTQRSINEFNRRIFQLLRLDQQQIGITKSLLPVVCDKKSMCLFKITLDHLEQVTWAFFLMMGPISCLTNGTTIRSRFAGTASVGTRLIASRICTGFHGVVVVVVVVYWEIVSALA